MNKYKIREFNMSGEVLEVNIVRTRGNYERMILEQMRDNGYVPVLDISPKVFTHIEDDKRYLSVTVCGAYVGRKDSWDIEGITDWKPVRRIPTVK